MGNGVIRPFLCSGLPAQPCPDFWALLPASLAQHPAHTFWVRIQSSYVFCASATREDACRSVQSLTLRSQFAALQGRAWCTAAAEHKAALLISQNTYLALSWASSQQAQGWGELYISFLCVSRSTGVENSVSGIKSEMQISGNALQNCHSSTKRALARVSPCQGAGLTWLW